MDKNFLKFKKFYLVILEKKNSKIRNLRILEKININSLQLSPTYARMFKY